MRCALFALLLLTAAGGAAQEDTAMAPLARSREAAWDLLTTLKATLTAHMQEGGPARAFALCADTAQVLTESIAAGYRVKIRRVSTRWRNPLDAPDEYENAVLEEFSQLLLKEELSDTTEHAAVTTEGQQRVFRYMRPIRLQAPCLVCHGATEALAPEVRNGLIEYYPDDQATGYSAGDLRGAVSVSFPIE